MMVHHGCNPAALRSLLYYAAQGLDAAQEFLQELAAFVHAREATLAQLSDLKEALKMLMAPKILGAPVVRHLSLIADVRKNYRRFFMEFPEKLQQFENILKMIDSPTLERIDIERDSEIARAEALLHIYVKETTGKFFTQHTAVLLLTGAVSYGLENMPSYDAETVHRRYTRWSRKYREAHALLTDLVQDIRGDGDEFFKKFEDAIKIGLALDSVKNHMVRQLMTIINGGDRKLNSRLTDPLVLFRSLFP